jgi:hypothetical protein
MKDSSLYQIWLSAVVQLSATDQNAGWENHYIEKLNAVRERQRKVIVKVNVI